MTAANTNFDTILSTTLNNYRNTLEDNIFKANPLTWWLTRNERLRTEDGGAKIIIPILGTKNADAGSYAGYDTISTSSAVATQIDAAEYPWAQFAASIAISGIEEAKNNGAERVINLLDAKINQAEWSMTEAMNQMFYLDGTGNSGKDWLGLAALVDSTGTVGNIDSSQAGNAFWRSTKESTAEVLSLSRMTNMYNSVSKGNDTPDLVLTTQTLFEKYEALLQPQLRFTDNAAADGGFQALLFKGATIMFDSYCQSGVVYFLNSKYLNLVKHRDVWFKNTSFVRPYNTDARYAQVLAYGQLVASNRARQGKLTAKTA